MFYSNVILQPFTTWSIASLFAALCGFPLLLSSSYRTKGEAKLHLSNKFFCLPDILKELNYRNYAFMTKHSTIGYMDQFLEKHYTLLDQRSHKIIEDTDLFPFIANFLTQVNEPFHFLILSSDTHYGYHVSCRNRKEISNLPKNYRAFDCADQMLEVLFRQLEKNRLLNRTEVLIYGDHPTWIPETTMGTNHTVPILFYPHFKNLNEEKPINIYDILPTILHFLNINHTTMFGDNLDSNTYNFKPPSNRDLKTLFTYFAQNM